MRALASFVMMCVFIFIWFVAIDHGLASKDILHIVVGVDAIVIAFIPIMIFASHRDYVIEKRHNLKNYFQRRKYAGLDRE